MCRKHSVLIGRKYRLLLICLALHSFATSHVMSAAERILVPTKMFIYEVINHDDLAINRINSGLNSKDGVERTKIDPPPAKIIGNRIVAITAGSWGADGLAMAFTTKSDKGYEYYWATLSLDDTGEKWAYAQIKSLPTMLDQPYYRPTFLVDGDGDSLRIQWEREILDVASPDIVALDWLVYINNCASISFDSGELFRLKMTSLKNQAKNGREDADNTLRDHIE